MNIKPIFWLGILIIGISGCMKDEVVLQDGWNKFDRPLNFAAPVANGHFSIMDILSILGDSSLIQSDSSGLIEAQYQQNVSVVWNDIISLPDISIDKNYNIFSAKKSTTTTFNYEERILINPRPDQIIDSMYIATSSLVIDVNSPSGLQGTIGLTIPELQKDGKALTFSTPIGTPLSKTENLSGYTLYPKQAPDSSYFRLLIVANVETPGSIPNQTNVNVKLDIKDLIPEVTFGYFGDSSVINRSYEFNIPVFDDLELAGMVEFKGMTIELDATNYYGIPFSMSLNNTILERTTTGEQLNIDFLVGNSIDMIPATYSSQVVPTLNYIKFDSLNSNINKAVNFFPDHMMFNVDVRINPSGEITHENFVTQNNKFDGNVKLTLPFWFRTSTYSRNDTISYDFSQIDSVTAKQIESLGLKFIFTNELPFDVTVQAYLLNESWAVVDSMFSSVQSLMVAGQLDSEDKVIQPTMHTVNVDLTGAQVQEYREKNVKNIILVIHAITADSGSRFVKLYNYYSIDFSLSGSLVSKPTFK